MRQRHDQTTAIVIPTGHNGFCCIIPCALFFALYGMIGVGALVLLWRAARRRFGKWDGPCGAGRQERKAA
ncbi:MAG: hypothetical protein ACR2JW_12125 [Thermomicrobiales bacterium]